MRNLTRGAWSRARDRSLRNKAANFAVIGVVNTGVDYCIFSFCYLVLGWRILAANVVAWLVSVSGSYVLNSYITFAAESGRVLRLRDYLTFVGSGVVGFVGNTATVLIASFFLPVLVAKLLAVAVSFVINFSMSNLVVFKKRPAADEPGQLAVERRREPL
ncbi:MAG: hypothetical protein QOD74_1134 [Variibacter sp.]|jgi:putative flippase GtrA|nr:hypothetical protein [Variibacter sp.]